MIIASQDPIWQIVMNHRLVSIILQDVAVSDRTNASTYV